MAEDNFTLTTFYSSWKAYQDHIKAAIAMLTTEQLALHAAPHLRSIGEIALHIIGCRAGWFTHFLGEDCGADVPEHLTTCSMWDKVEHMYGTGEVLPLVHAGAGGAGVARVQHALFRYILDGRSLWRGAPSRRICTCCKVQHHW